MMRSWGNRDDTVVIDQPFYAYYLKVTGIDHPGADDVIATGETDWRKVVAHLTGPITNGKRIFFQKQMTHHLLPEIDREWLEAVTNCFLIRDPREVINSYLKKREDPALEDFGFVQQAEIFDFVRTRTNAFRPLSMPETCWKIRRGLYDWFAKRSASSLASQCSRGHQACVTPMASGPGIGMAKWQNRPHFNRIVRH